MKHVKLLVLICCVYAIAFAEVESAEIKTEAEQAAKALLTGDFEGIVNYTHSRVIDGMGGKAALIATLKQGVEDMRRQGFRFERVTVGAPEKPRSINNWLVCFIPETITMKAPGGHLIGESHLFGISENGGKSWVFVDVGPINQSQFNQVFPEFAGAVSLPPKKKSVFKKEEKS